VSGSHIAHAPPQGPPRDGRGEVLIPERDQGSPVARGSVLDTGFLRRAEVRDVLAWMSLLVDPQDAAAVARALARPPIELRQVDLARVIQVARRRKLDLVLGVGAATEAPQVPPEARERIERFVELHRAAATELEELEPETFLGRLIERLGAPQRSLLAPEAAAEVNGCLARLRELAADFMSDRPLGSTSELVAHLAALSPQEPPPAGTKPEPPHPERQPRAQRELLEELLGQLRGELAAGVARIGGRLGELRLDTDLDIAHGVVRYLELLKVSALLQRDAQQSLEEALADTNARLLAAASPLQREVFQTSTLDETLLREASQAHGEHSPRARVMLAREEHSLAPFLPRKGSGLALSASDIQTYRSCPLRYKYARVLRIPTEQTVHQRFGIVVHQVLERYHAAGAQTLEQLLELLDAVWRRSALAESGSDLELLDKARAALLRYHARLQEQPAQPVWFERAFSFRLGPHHLRGRVDRVDLLPELSPAQYELIDYKTSRPKSAEELAGDVQLSLYAIAAREDWHVESPCQSYYYVLDDVKVPVAQAELGAQALEGMVLEVGEGILAQEFEPRPSRSLCASCDYRIICPAAEL